jgi:hypothetical protein
MLGKRSVISDGSKKSRAYYAGFSSIRETDRHPMNTGDIVQVYPHGHPDQAADGTVVMISMNKLSIAVSFGDKPSFASAHWKMASHPQHGIVLLAHRYAVNGIPIGPWIEVFDGGHYEIEGAPVN